MFKTKKFGAYLSKLRKNADMTQSELAEKLNLTRKAISKYEVGDSFPDISILLLIAELFNVALDKLIKSGEPSQEEALIMEEIAQGKENLKAADITDFVDIAPFLKPSVLSNLADNLEKQGIDIQNIVKLAEYLKDESVQKLLINASFERVNEELLEKLLPFLDQRSKNAIFENILEGKIDWHMIKILIFYDEDMTSQIEAAVVAGVLPWEALDVMHEGMVELYRRNEEGK